MKYSIIKALYKSRKLVEKIYNQLDKTIIDIIEFLKKNKKNTIKIYH